ncbi:sensor histidine kinase [Paenibacillus sp. H1-7]|uniref:sensor histidine kinase n=1 Tax=Paenibacillus sp. H1-7 TaxID=2282849 RepID=UPI001EF8B593|nr:HAMP domain-containing sensor histidine kinase [Paenibacillus sp. H1-7]ULL16264.1 sensor histidine kinase [Paenibacillus sp. H1-7]
MMRDKWLSVLVVQLLALGVLFFLVWPSSPFDMIRGGLFAVLFITTITFIMLRIRTLRKTQQRVYELKRAIEGNLNTRLLANDDPELDAFIFAINELIEQLDRLQVRTLQSEAARKQLLSNISHDIRTPLTSIIGYIDALRDEIGVTEEEKQQYLDILGIKASALKHLIDDLFHLAKLDADEIVMKPETLDLAEMTRETVIEFLPELKLHSMELKAAIPEAVCRIQGDRISLQRIMRNVIKNAIQYGKEGKVLGIELTETDTSYEWIVWDKGPGIAAGDLSKIFERMYRADRSRSPRYGGSGLGLAIAKALVEKHGGTLWAESIPGERTTFACTIPKRYTYGLRNN